MSARRVPPLRLFTAALLGVALLVSAATSVTAQPLAKDEKYRRTVERYTVPDVTLYDQEGRRTSLRELVKSDLPVLLDFIYGTCTTICPVLSAGFANFQRKHPDAARVRLISITIDPEHDRPEVLKEYLQRYEARPGWEFLTGTRQDIDLVMRAFDAYVPNKMSHYPITFIRRPASGEWVRIYGLIGTRELLSEYQAAVESR